tara:strand:- start:164 stop:499 length:336 start_codon:yes stop_codon:yes gene_type:complete
MDLDNIFHILLILIIVCIAVCIYIRKKKIENMDVIIENLSVEDSSSNETSSSSSLQSAVIANSSILKQHSGTIDIHDEKITNLETTQQQLKTYQDWIKSKVKELEKDMKDK